MNKIKILIGRKGEENIDDINKASFNINDGKEKRDLQITDEINKINKKSVIK